MTGTTRHANPADTAFVGRQPELSVLRAALDDAFAGNGRLVMLAGEPGIGKTRIAGELADYATQHAARVLWGRCHEEAGAPPYWPWVQIFRLCVHDHDADALQTDLGPGAADIADIVPEIRARLPGLEPPARLQDPAETRFRMFESIARFLANLCRRQALVLVLDDLHWADVSSLRLLQFLAPEIAGSRLLVIGTYRETELSRQHPLSDALGGLARVPHFARVHLSGLSAPEVHQFIAAATGSVPPGWLAGSIYEQTEGNPLFLREVVRFLEQEGVFQPVGSAEHADMRVAARPLIRIPEGLREVIGRRLNLLSATCNEVLAVAAVIGRNFALDVLQRAADKFPGDALLEALDEAVSARIIEETAAAQYQFTHNLVRLTLYDELRTARRRGLHRVVGGAIEALRRGDLDPFLPDLARHFLEAAGNRDVDRAIDYATRAGERADALLAFEDAIYFFQSALHMLEQADAADAAQRGTLLFLLGESQRKANDFPHALENLRAAAEAASAWRMPELLARAALAYEQTAWRQGMPADPPPERLLERALQNLAEADVALRAQVTGALARALVYAGAEAAAQIQAARAVALARQLSNPAVLATSLSSMFGFFRGPHDTGEFLARATEMLGAAEQAGNMELVAVAHSWRVALHLELGDLQAVEADLEALTRVDARIRQATYSVHLFGYRTMLALTKGDLEAAERIIQQAMDLLAHSRAKLSDLLSVQIFTLRREQGRLAALQPAVAAFLRQHAAATWRPGLALLHVELGHLEDARAEFERLAVEDFSTLPRDGRWTTCMVYLAEVCAALGDTARAAALYRLLLPYADSNIVLGNGVGYSGSGGRHLGLLCTTMSRWPDAEIHFEAALAMNARTGARAPLIHTQHDYAAMLLARDGAGDREKAAALLRLAGDSARTLGMCAAETKIADRLAAVSKVLAAPKIQDGPAQDDLTVRELEVLQLIAIGRSNADIAFVLAISLNTVATHVRNILAKTGCAIRTEAAAYAMRHGLTGAA